MALKTDDAADVIYRADTIMGDGWHHITAVHTFGRATETRLYLDGKPLSGRWVAERSHVNGFAYPNTSQPYLIGQMKVGGTAFYDGLLDELRIWNVARTESEIETTMMHELTGDETGLAGYWKFNEPPGETLARDASPHGNDGDLRGDAQFQVADTPLLLEPSQDSTWVHPLDGMEMVHVPAVASRWAVKMGKPMRRHYMRYTLTLFGSTVWKLPMPSSPPLWMIPAM